VILSTRGGFFPPIHLGGISREIRAGDMVVRADLGGRRRLKKLSAVAGDDSPAGDAELMLTGFAFP